MILWSGMQKCALFLRKYDHFDLLDVLLSLSYRPKLLVAGASAYSRHIDYARMRKVSQCKGWLLSDCDILASLRFDLLSSDRRYEQFSVVSGYGPH